MNANQEPKYKIDNNRLVNRQSGEAIPDDEPVFVLRARDGIAAKTLAFYLAHASGDEHSTAVFKRLLQFRRWDRQHPERMHNADTVLTSDWDNLT